MLEILFVLLLVKNCNLNIVWFFISINFFFKDKLCLDNFLLMYVVIFCNFFKNIGLVCFGKM